MILITGGNGNLGRSLIEKLVRTFPSNNQLMISVRDRKKAGPLISAGLLVRQADYNDPQSMRQAFQTARKVFLVSAWDPTGKRIELHKNTIREAKNANVEHIVYTSFLNPKDSRFEFGKCHYETEEYLKESGLAFTIVRNTLYADNLLKRIPEIMKTSMLVSTAPKGRVGFLSREDIAEACACIITEDGHENRTYELTGSRTYSFDEIAQILSEVLGQKIGHKVVSTETIRSYLISQGMPEHMVPAHASSYRAIEAGEYDIVRRDFQTIIGRGPTSLEKFLEASIGSS